MLMAQEIYLSAEVDYRLERATALFGRPRPERLRVPRRRTLHLPHPPRRPVVLA